MQAIHVFPVTKFAQAIAKCMPSVIICMMSKEEIVSSLDLFKNSQFVIDNETKRKLALDTYDSGAYAIFTRKRNNVMAVVFNEPQFHVGEYKLKDVAALLSNLPKGRMLAIKRMGVSIDVNVSLTPEIVTSVLSA